MRQEQWPKTQTQHCRNMSSTQNVFPLLKHLLLLIIQNPRAICLPTDWFNPWPWRVGKWRMDWNITYVQNSAQTNKCRRQWTFTKWTQLNNRHRTGVPPPPQWPSSLYLKRHRVLNSHSWHRCISRHLHNKWHCNLFVRFAPTVECSCGSVTVIAGECFILWLYHNLYIYSTEDDVCVVSISGPLPMGCQEYSRPCQM